MQAIRLQETVKKDGELYLKNLPLIKGQHIELLVLFAPQPKPKERLTARKLLNSGLIGLWKNRTDIVDSTVYARQLREQAQR